MIDQSIRRLARKEGLIAHKSQRDGLWRFANERNCLVSPDIGLDEEEALEYLTQGDEDMSEKATSDPKMQIEERPLVQGEGVMRIFEVESNIVFNRIVPVGLCYSFAIAARDAEEAESAAMNEVRERIEKGELDLESEDWEQYDEVKVQLDAVRIYNVRKSDYEVG